jgi:OmpA-OmpF porin, OOP family
MAWRIGTAVLVLLAASTTVNAQSSRFYVGAGIGQSGAKFGDCSSSFPSVQVCEIEDSDTGWKLFGGYKLREDIALEASYVDLGKFRITAWGNFETAASSYEVRGFAFDAVKTWSLGSRFGISARLGIFAWNFDASSTASGFGGYTSSNEKTTDVNGDFGLGLKYDLYKDIAAVAEFQRFLKIGSDATGKSDVDLISASIVFRFK